LLCTRICATLGCNCHTALQLMSAYALDTTLGLCEAVCRVRCINTWAPGCWWRRPIISQWTPAEIDFCSEWLYAGSLSARVCGGELLTSQRPTEGADGSVAVARGLTLECPSDTPPDARRPAPPAAVANGLQPPELLIYGSSPCSVTCALYANRLFRSVGRLSFCRGHLRPFSSVHGHPEQQLTWMIMLAVLFLAAHNDDAPAASLSNLHQLILSFVSVLSITSKVHCKKTFHVNPYSSSTVVAHVMCSTCSFGQQ